MRLKQAVQLSGEREMAGRRSGVETTGCVEGLAEGRWEREMNVTPGLLA